MEVASREIRYNSRKDSFKITFLGDVHLGGKDCRVDMLKACVDRIASDDNHYWFGMGDWGEFINFSDKRFDPSELDTQLLQLKDLADLPKVQCDIAGRILKPIGGKCLGLISGNHEEKIRLKYHQNIHAVLCHTLGSKHGNLDLGYSAIVKLKMVRSVAKSSSMNTIKIYLHHGTGGGRKTGAKINRIEDCAISFPFCQIYAAGHVHTRVASQQIAIDATSEVDELISRPRAFFITGTFKETYYKNGMGYGEKVQYPATSLGCVSAIISGQKADGTFNISTFMGSDGLPA